MSIVIKGDYDALFAEFDRIDSLPDGKAKILLDAVLEEGFKETQLRVHVITGALKASGKKSSSTSKHQWKGKITYGGPSKPKNVDYAIYEKRRSADHDFLGNLHLMHSRYVEALLAALKG